MNRCTSEMAQPAITSASKCQDPLEILQRPQRARHAIVAAR